MPTISEPLGRVLGNRYQLVAALGSGASAHVFLAEDMVLQRRVAVKVLQPALAGDETFLRRFRAEARSVAALNHPHVLRVFDWGEGEDGPYLVLEYLERGSLFDVLSRDRRLTPGQAARVGAQAADGLAYAHTRGIVHRDVKPANILFDEEGRVRVADFGVARALSSASTTDPGTMLGTARYASPEQAQGNRLDGRSDVYSLALVLYEALTGIVPFARETPHATLQARIGQTLPGHPALGPLAQLLATAAAPDPADRYDAAVLAGRMQRLADDLAPGAPLPLLRRAPDGTLEADDPPADTTQVGRSAGADGTTGTEAAARGLEHPDEVTIVGGVAAVTGTDATGVLASSRAAEQASATGRGVPASGTGTGTGNGTGWAPSDPAGALGSSPPADATAAVPLVSSRGTMRGGLADTGEPTATIVLGDGALRTARRRGRRRRWPWVVAVVLLLACLAAAGAVYAVHRHLFVNNNRQLPSVVGDTLTSARQTLRGEHFVVRVEPAAQSTSVAAGRVIRQEPAAGKSLASGSTVRLFPSKGMPPVQVPSLSNNVDCALATQLLQEVHLRVNCPAQSAYSNTVPQGDVTAWSYNGQIGPVTVPYGATVDITVSKGPAPVTVPSFAKQTWTQASATLTTDGLVPKEVQAYSTTIPTGQVIATTPPAGTTVPASSAITVTVSNGPQYVPVPKVVGDTVTKATAAIQAAKLTVGAIYGPGTGQVFTTDPLAGQKEKVGTAIALYTEPPPTKTPGGSTPGTPTSTPSTTGSGTASPGTSTSTTTGSGAAATPGTSTTTTTGTSSSGG